MAESFPVLEEINQKLSSFMSFQKRYFTEVVKSKNSLTLSEYRYAKYFDWELRETKTLVVHSAEIKEKSSNHLDSTDLDHFMSDKIRLTGHFLLNLTGTVVAKYAISRKNIPDAFKHISTQSRSDIYLARFDVVTSKARNVQVFGNIELFNPIVVGVRYYLSNIQCTGAEQVLGWLTPISCVEAVGYNDTLISYGLTEVPNLASIDRAFVWNLVNDEKVANGYYIISARVLKLIKLEISIDGKHTAGRSPSSHPNLAAKLVASLDDSSCGFLGVAYDHVVAYILGIGEEAWTEIRALVFKNGPLEITMKSDDTESRLVRLLRRSFARASLQNNRDMIVKIQPHGQYANSAGGLIVITRINYAKFTRSEAKATQLQYTPF